MRLHRRDRISLCAIRTAECAERKMRVRSESTRGKSGVTVVVDLQGTRKTGCRACHVQRSSPPTLMGQPTPGGHLLIHQRVLEQSSNVLCLTFLICEKSQ